MVYSLKVIREVGLQKYGHYNKGVQLLSAYANKKTYLVVLPMFFFWLVFRKDDN